MVQRFGAGRLIVLRFVDAFSFSFAWLAVGLWSSRVSGAGGFAAVTSAIYIAYPAAVLLVGPAVRRFGSRRTLSVSAVGSGLLLAAAFPALRLGVPFWLLLALMAAQSLSGSMASELLKHGVASAGADVSLPRLMVAYRAGFGAGGLLSSILLAAAVQDVLVAVGIAAAALSSVALLSASPGVASGFSPGGLGEVGRWFPSSMRSLAPMLALFFTLAPVLSVAPGVVAAGSGEFAAGVLTAAVAAGALLGPPLGRWCRSRPSVYAPLALLALLLTASLADVRAALLLLPFAAAAFDVVVVRQEEVLHRAHPSEPGALALPGLVWSLGVGSAAVPVSLLLGEVGAPAVSLLFAGLFVTTNLVLRSRAAS